MNQCGYRNPHITKSSKYAEEREKMCANTWIIRCVLFAHLKNAFKIKINEKEEHCLAHYTNTNSFLPTLSLSYTFHIMF